MEGSGPPCQKGGAFGPDIGEGSILIKLEVSSDFVVEVLDDFQFSQICPGLYMGYPGLSK